MARPAGYKLNGFALRELRAKCGYNVTEAAAAAGIKQSAWSNIEAGRRRASREVVHAIQAALLIADVRSFVIFDNTIDTVEKEVAA